MICVNLYMAVMSVLKRGYLRGGGGAPIVSIHSPGRRLHGDSDLSRLWDALIGFMGVNGLLVHI